jgi:hypothetical protein
MRYYGDGVGERVMCVGNKSNLCVICKYGKCNNVVCSIDWVEVLGVMFDVLWCI